VRPANDVTLSVGTGRHGPPQRADDDLFVANDDDRRRPGPLAEPDLHLRQGRGQTTVYATDAAAGRLFGQRPRRPESRLGRQMLAWRCRSRHHRHADERHGAADRHGRAARRRAEAERLVQAFVGDRRQVVSRLRTATPQQVMLQVRIAEVSRSLLREIGTNLLSRDQSAASCSASAAAIPARSRHVHADRPHRRPADRLTFNNPLGATTLGAAGHLLGVDILGTLNLGETTGQVTTLAEPTLVALSGETATFLAGGEFPIPISAVAGHGADRV
jgi:pilus assembly protein CpaC